MSKNQKSQGSSLGSPHLLKAPRRHPLFGSMKGTFTIAPGVDLTEPATPEWADLIDEKYSKGCDDEGR
jgi:hypothetical protein